MGRTGDVATRQLAAVTRALAVLDALADGNGDVGTNDLARTVGINASTVSRILATLVAAGYAERVAESGRYRLGPRVVHLSHAVLARLDVRRVARPTLEALVEATGETATLSLPSEHDAVTADHVPGRASVISVARVGRPSIPHCTAVGKVMLAFGRHGTAALSEPLTAFTTRTITDRETLDAVLATVREDGFATAVGERESDLNAIAAPVFDGRGLVGILGVQGPAARFTAEVIASTTASLLVAAADVTTALGGERPPS